MTEPTSPAGGRGELLAVCTLPPWPRLNGYSLRVSHLLEHLAGRWSITLIAPPCATLPPGIARHIPVKLHGSGLTYPWRFDQTALRTALDQTVRTHCPERALVWAGAENLWFGRSDLPRAVIDVIDCNPLEFWRGLLSYHGLHQRLRALREIVVAARFARHTVRSSAATVCVGEADARWLRRLGGGGTVHVVPNGVELPPPASIPEEAAEPVLSFTGALDYRPNIEAALFAFHAIWPLVRRAAPRASFVIAGRNPVAEIRALDGRNGIQVQPDVPDMVQVLGRCWVSIAPMRSGVGIKNKVLEAWACERPVALTPLAANGLALPADHAGLVASGAAALAASVVILFHDAELRRRLGRSARAHVAAHCTWAGAAAQVDVLLRELAPFGTRPGPFPCGPPTLMQ